MPRAIHTRRNSGTSDVDTITTRSVWQPLSFPRSDKRDPEQKVSMTLRGAMDVIDHRSSNGRNTYPSGDTQGTDGDEAIKGSSREGMKADKTRCLEDHRSTLVKSCPRCSPPQLLTSGRQSCPAMAVLDPIDIIERRKCFEEYLRPNGWCDMAKTAKHLHVKRLFLRSAPR